ncbi:MAG: hypothetical protein ACT4UQ_00170 [Gammaproteobacteria bacterium]
MRAGTKSDGRLALVMPNKAHQRLTDRPPGRLGIAMGEFDLEEMRAVPRDPRYVMAGS